MRIVKRNLTEEETTTLKNRLKQFFKTIKGSLTAKIILGILFFVLSLGTVLITIAQKWFTDAV